MGELELYKFIKENDIEYHWNKNDGNDDVIIFINFYELKDWSNLLGGEITHESGIDCIMKDGYFCFWMDDICGYFGIDITKVFDKENEK